MILQDSKLGPRAQANTKSKSAVGAAVEASNRKTLAKRTADAQLVRDAATTKEALAAVPLQQGTLSPKDIAALKTFIKDPERAVADAPGTVECTTCNDVYGAVVRISSHRVRTHNREYHPLGKCVVCGQPVIGRDTTQYRRHRTKCPKWDALRDCKLQWRWVLENGLVDSSSGQFWDANERAAACRVAPGDVHARRALLRGFLNERGDAVGDPEEEDTAELDDEEDNTG